MHTLLLTAIFLVPTASFAAPFSDVPDSHPNADAIAYVKAEGIVEGYADPSAISGQARLFKPDATINRAEFTKIVIGALWKAEDLPKCLSGEGIFADMPMSPSRHFSDVDYATAWYRDYLCVARSMDVIRGYPDGTFRPGNPINTVEAAKIIVNGFGIAYSNKHDPDVAARRPWYQPYIEDLADRNAIPVSITGLDQAITRGEMAEMIYRLKTGNQDAPSRTYDMLRLRTEIVTGATASFEITYPDWWGDLEMQENYGGEYIGWGFTGLQATPWNAHVTVQADRDELQFITKCSGRMDCPFDTDFETYRAMFRPNRTLPAGVAVEVDDGYSPGGGVFYRNAYFFRGDEYVTVGGSAIFAMYDDEYVRRQALGQQPSITELVLEDISDNDQHPMDTVFVLHPEKTVAEQRFFMQIDAMIGSIR